MAGPIETGENQNVVPEPVAKSVEIPPYGQKALEIILEDQKRVARLKGVTGIHSSDRPVIEVGRAMSALILEDFMDETRGNVTVQTRGRQQAVFESELFDKLFTEVQPGKPAKAVGKGWYHNTLRIYLIGQSGYESQGPHEEIDYHVPIDLCFRMRLSRDSRKIVFKVSADSEGGDSKKRPIFKRRLVFKAFSTPDFRGKIHERLASTPR